MTTFAKKIAVIGAGWAGCAAAVELARTGHQVTLFEASRVLGGRARRVDIHGISIDNGQHILLGAYRHSLQLLRTVGIDPATALLRLPLQMCYPANSGGMSLIAARLPAPLHVLLGLWHAQGINRADKLALARFMSAARWMDWQLHDDCSVDTLLTRFEQTDRLMQLMWRPLCIAALNTPPARASAQVFLTVLRDSLGARRAASDMLLPRLDLSQLFPEQAATFIERHGGTVQRGCSIQQLQRRDGQWQLSGNSITQNSDAVVLATPPATAASLLQGLANTALIAQLNGFTYEPITTCYLQYSANICLPQPFFALIDQPSADIWGQFVFDRGQLDPAHAGLLAVVISAASDAIDTNQTVLATTVATQLANTFKLPQLTQPNWVKVISEKRATFSCSPNLTRPANTTGLTGLTLAGDYTASDYPATLEAAACSGLQAVQELTL